MERKGNAALIGYCGLKPVGEYVDLSYMIAQEYWGQGYTMEADGTADNIASIRILE